MSIKPTHAKLLARVEELEAMALEDRLPITDFGDGGMLYKTLFDKMLDEVHIWELVRGADGQIQTWRLVGANPSALETWGRSLSEVKGKTTDEIFPEGRATETFMPIVQKIFHEQKPHIWEKYFAGTGQTLYMVSIPVGERFISCGIDVSEIRRTEADLLEKTSEINNTLMAVVSSMSKALESRDAYTAGHQQRVAYIAESIAHELQLDTDRIEGIRLGASIHDIGKISIPAVILTKPTPLDQAEYNIVKAHVEAGAKIISGIKFPWPIHEIIMQHHERLDGSGYPRGLKADEIIMEARIVAVADVFESISSYRSYRKALGQAAALEELTKHKGVLYDEDVVDAVERLIASGKLALEDQA